MNESRSDEPGRARPRDGSSNPVGWQDLNTIKFRAPVAQLDRVLPSEGRGRRFKSCRARHSKNATLAVAFLYGVFSKGVDYRDIVEIKVQQNGRTAVLDAPSYARRPEQGEGELQGCSELILPGPFPAIHGLHGTCAYCTSRAMPARHHKHRVSGLWYFRVPTTTLG